ncbi:MAG: sugar transferase [Propionicimonas sp.]
MRIDVKDYARAVGDGDTPDVASGEFSPTWAAELRSARPLFEPVNRGREVNTATAGAAGEDGAKQPLIRRESNLPPAHRARWDADYRRRAVLVDVILSLCVSNVGGAVRFGQETSPRHLLLVFLLPPAWLIAVALNHGYERRFLAVGVEEYRALVQATIVLVALIGFVSFAGRLDIQRGFVTVVFPTLLLVSLVARKLQRRRICRRREHGQSMQPTVVIGRAAGVRELVRQIQDNPAEGMHVVAVCVSGLATDWDGSSDVEGVPVFGYPEEAMSAVDLFDAEVVAVASHPDLVGKELRRLAWSLEERKVDLVVSPGILEVAGPRLSIRPVAGMPLLHVERPPMSGVRRTVKRLVDSVLTLVVCLVALPALGAVAILVRLDSPGPILFQQKRVGAQGEEFLMLKFRTMVADAETRLVEMTSAGHDANSRLFKMKDDPRVTRIGKLLRRYSLDELPQLLNVLRGEMSLVGPRPPLPSEVAEYESDAIRRLRVRPGLSGLWQVSGRSDLSWDESLRLDLWYVDNWSLMLDLQILSRTARAVFVGKGAY